MWRATKQRAAVLCQLLLLSLPVELDYHVMWAAIVYFHSTRTLWAPHTHTHAHLGSSSASSSCHHSQSCDMWQEYSFISFQNSKHSLSLSLCCFVQLICFPTPCGNPVAWRNSFGKSLLLKKGPGLDQKKEFLESCPKRVCRIRHKYDTRRSKVVSGDPLLRLILDDCLSFSLGHWRGQHCLLCISHKWQATLFHWANTTTQQRWWWGGCRVEEILKSTYVPCLSFTLHFFPFIPLPPPTGSLPAHRIKMQYSSALVSLLQWRKSCYLRHVFPLFICHCWFCK